jgi:hypothetical protein
MHSFSRRELPLYYLTGIRWGMSERLLGLVLPRTGAPIVNVWARGAIVQSSDLRPPLGIEIKIQGKDIFAVRAE